MIRLFLIILVCTQVVLAAGSPASVFTGQPETGRILPGTREISASPWQKQTRTGWQSVHFPVYSDSASLLRLGARFKLSVKSDSLPAWLYLSGISGTVTIYLNKILVGFHTNDTGPFVLRLPAMRLSQNNELQLRIEPPSGEMNSFPFYVRQFAEAQQTGIRTVPKILISSKQKISGFTLSLEALGKKASIRYTYRLTLPKRKIKYRIDETIRSAGYQRTRFVSGGETEISGKLSIPLSQLWSPEKPYLIRTEISVTERNTVIARRRYATGLRTLRYTDKTLYINQKPVFIHGINYHLDLKRFSRPYRRHIQTDFRNIKNLGFNAIRLIHFLPDDVMLSTADSLGLLLFGELPLRRLPLPFFYSDVFLENAKTAINNMRLLQIAHPSLIAFGLGQEISLSDAATQKFMFILKGEVRNKLHLLSYLAPFPCGALPLENAADFYLLDSYLPLQKLNPQDMEQPDAFFLAGRIASVWNEPAGQWDADPASVQRQKFLKREFDAMINTLKLKGGFVESYQDWHMQLPGPFNSAQAINHSGLHTIEGAPKYWIPDFTTLWNGTESTLLTLPGKAKRTNLFSLVAIFGSLLFFGVYHKHRRMKENIRKAIRHPYGFFVDMRERRIIPLFISFMVGGYAALLLGSILGAIIYFYHTSYKVMEFAAVLLQPLGLYRFFIHISADPAYSLLFGFAILLSFPLVVSLIIKLFALLSGERIRYRQGLAIGLWSGVPLFFLMPVSLGIFQILMAGGYETALYLLLLFFTIWAHIRIINGIRVLFITRMAKVMLIMLLSYIIPVVILWALFTPMPHWPDYLKLVMQARCLF